jgi:hypothetical protein
MRTPRFLRIAIPVAGALLVAGGAIAVTASAAGLRLSPLAATASPSPKTGAGPTAAGDASTTCQAYLGHLATQLGVSRTKLDAAALAAAKATVQDHVTSGKLTQAQADKIEARLQATGACSAAIGELGRPAKATVARGAYLTAAAAALGVTEAQLKADLKNGQSLSVAAAQNVSEADFKTKLAAALKPKLDAAVAARTITQAQEDAQLAKLQAGDPPYWTSTHK